MSHRGGRDAVRRDESLDYRQSLAQLMGQGDLAEIEAIAGPVDGLIVYCTDCGAEGGGAGHAP